MGMRPLRKHGRSSKVGMLVAGSLFAMLAVYLVFFSSALSRSMTSRRALPVDPCADELHECASYVQQGRCKDPVAIKGCRLSCGLCGSAARLHPSCHNDHTECEAWANRGECARNPNFMQVSCKESCGECNGVTDLLRGKCLRVEAPGVFAPLAGLYRMSQEYWNGHPTFVHVGGTGWIFRSRNGEWTITGEYSSVLAGSGHLHQTSPSDLPTASTGWVGVQGTGWVPMGGVSVALTSESCQPARLPVPVVKSLPKQIEEAMRSPPKVVRGVHYEADYDITNLKPAPPAYNYPAKPAFRYIEDVPGAPKIPYVIMSHQPKVYYFPRFLSDEEADAIQADASKRMVRSQVVPIGGKRAEGTDEVRTSSGAWMSNSVPEVKAVRERILATLGFHPDQTEKLHVLRYLPGQKYNTHLDYFEPIGARNEAEAQELWKIKWDHNWNRAATFFLYLNTCEEGGETVLPRANGGPPIVNMTDCTRGLRVRPIKGSAVIFYDMRPDFTQDEYTLHGGCPVKKGVKWAAPQWLHVKVREAGNSDSYWD